MKLRFIALKQTRYSDKQNILTAFSRERGRVSFAVATGNGRGAARLRALTLPMSVVECETDSRPGRELMPLRQARPIEIASSVHSNPLKQMLAMFLAEVVGAVARESGPDEDVYDFIEASVRCLDALPEESLGNFHICFLMTLGRLYGIEPDVSTYAPGWILDMREGIWRLSFPLHGDALSPEESTAAWQLWRMKYANMHAFRYTRIERARVIDTILRYYSLHLTPLQGIKSLDILRSLF